MKCHWNCHLQSHWVCFGKSLLWEMNTNLIVKKRDFCQNDISLPRFINPTIAAQHQRPFPAPAIVHVCLWLNGAAATAEVHPAGSACKMCQFSRLVGTQKWRVVQEVEAERVEGSILFAYLFEHNKQVSGFLGSAHVSLCESVCLFEPNIMKIAFSCRLQRSKTSRVHGYE